MFEENEKDADTAPALSNESTERSTKPVARPRPGSLWRWPFVLYVCCVLVLNFLVFFAMANAVFTGWEVYAIMATPAFIGGELAVFGLVCGLVGRRWTIGFVIASILGSLAALSLLGGFLVPWFNQISLDSDIGTLSFAALIPAFLLLSSLPLIAIRFVRGWRLSPDPGAEQVERVGMEDLFVLTAMIAATLYMVRVPEVVLEVRKNQMWGGLFIISIFLPMVGAATLIPYVWARFRVANPALRLLCQFVAIVLPVAIFELAYTMSFSFSGGAVVPTLSYILPGVVGGVLFAMIFVWGVSAIGWSGFQLVSNRTLRSDPSYDAQAKQSGVWTNRIVAAALVIGVVAANSGLILVEKSRQNRDWQLVSFGAEITRQGGRVEVEQREVITLVLGPETTDEDLRKLDSFPGLKELSCEDSQITDAALPMIREKFPGLKALNLAGTKISHACADELLEMVSLRKLSIARTQLDAPTVMKIAAIQSSGFVLGELDIGGLELTEAELVEVATSVPRSTLSLGLSGYGLNDKQLQPILDALTKNTTRFDSLDLSDNPIDGSCLANLKSFQVTKLLLNNTKVTDANLKKILPLSLIQWLEVQNTEVTNAFLPILMGSAVNNLKIGDGKVTEAGIVKHLPFYMGQLGLHGKQFTGEKLFTGTGTLGVSYLDLSSSGIRDKALEDFAKTTVFSLDLSDTDITDSGLTNLAKAQFLGSVNLSGTKVTAAGLAKGELQRLQSVVVSSDQFTLDEIKAISKVINLKTDGPSLNNPYAY